MRLSFRINRVVIDDSGHAVSLKAAEELGHRPDIVFERDDGWTLGAPFELADIAYQLWPEEWVAFRESPSFVRKEMRTYRGW